jgi:Tfp pilus assembly protein PilO
MMARQQLLLGFVAILMLIKFGFGYINNARAESRELLETKSNRYVKGKRLLDTESSLDSELEALNQYLEKAREFYPIADSAQNARLSVQRQINELAEKSNLTVESAEWLSIEEGQPERAIFDLRFSGDFDAMAKFHLAVEELGAWINVQEISANIRRQRVTSRTIGAARGSMLFNVLYVVDDQ